MHCNTIMQYTYKTGNILRWFTNTGATDLQIELITACECTTLDWTRLPVAPGARSKIKIRYNSKD